jgi:hypothetical protein
MSTSTLRFKDEWLSELDPTPFRFEHAVARGHARGGDKEVMIWDRHDRDPVTEEELEALFGKPEIVDTRKAGAYVVRPRVGLSAWGRKSSRP